MITAHTLIKNEENFIWYSVISVIDFIDNMFIWDTGSSDSTNKIIEELVKRYPDKVEYKEIGDVNENEYSSVRQRMLDQTKNGWIFILDGDEVWWNKSISRVCNYIHQNNDKETIIVPTVNMIGDMFHYQENAAGKYVFGNRKGHLALRFINKKIPGLHVGDRYGKEGFFDENNSPIQNRDVNKMIYLDMPYMHTTHLKRSSGDEKVMQRKKKLKYEIGIEVTKDFYYPEAFFKNRPSIIPNVWGNTGLEYKFKAIIETPLKKIRRRIK